MKYRTEKDTLGEVKVPAGAYYGAQTARAVENFPISGLRADPIFVKATAMVKCAAAKANMECEVLDLKIGDAIVRAAMEVIDGKLREHFVVDIYQAGAGTSHNMNTNEVIANRASEMLGGKIGDYSLVHPNDHVNMSQSTNDSFPTAMRLAALMKAEGLLDAVQHFHDSLQEKAVEFDHIVKSGRTHLQDAVPVRLGQEFGGYAVAIKKGRGRIEAALDSVKILGIGASAAGTGLNTPGGYRDAIVRHLAELTGHPVEGAEDLFEATQSMGDFATLSSAIRNLALEITRIANDLRLLSSGPTSGFGEIVLPPVQPGSSIMPGKVNPVMAEMLNMVAFQVAGNDHTVEMSVQAGQMELNVMMPVINHNVLSSMEILTNALKVFSERCIKGITANEERCRDYSESTVALATVLNLHMGYNKAAEVAKEAAKTGKTVREVVFEKGLLTEEEAAEILDIKKMT